MQAKKKKKKGIVIHSRKYIIYTKYDMTVYLDLLVSLVTLHFR